MYFDDYGHEYETIEDAEKAFAKRFDEEMNNIEDFSETLWYFSDLRDVLKILYEKDKTILDILKNHYSKEIEKEKREYVKEKIANELEEG
jgi:lysyl-tRNA synthetase class I